MYVLTISRLVPKFLRKTAEKEETEEKRKWILKGVEGECHSGEVLAMWVSSPFHSTSSWIMRKLTS